MLDTNSKYRLVEIGKLRTGDVFYTSKELEDEGFKVSNIRLLSKPNMIIGIGLSTGVQLGWAKDCPIYIKEDG